MSYIIGFITGLLAGSLVIGLYFIAPVKERQATKWWQTEAIARGVAEYKVNPETGKVEWRWKE